MVSNGEAALPSLGKGHYMPGRLLAAPNHFKCISLFPLIQIFMFFSYLLSGWLMGFVWLVFLPKIFMVIPWLLFNPIFGIISVVCWLGIFGKYPLKQLWVFHSYTLFTFTYLFYQRLLARLFYQGKATRVPPQRCSTSSLYATTALLHELPELRLHTDPS